MAAGVEFFVSSNGVILTPGLPADGCVPPSCFDRVVDVASGRVVFRDGADAEPSSAASEPNAEDIGGGGGGGVGAGPQGKHRGKGGKGGNGGGKGKFPGGLRNQVGGAGGGGGGAKASWPELVGQQGGAAAAALRSERPELRVVVVPEGSNVTMDHNLGRVRVFVGPGGAVARPPKLG